MRVYCNDCDFKKDYDGISPLRRCPKCRLRDLFFEENLSWNVLSVLWAISKGRERSYSGPSLPEWICEDGRRLHEWHEFKVRLRNPVIIGLPPLESCQDEFDWLTKAREFWWDKTGINALEQAINADEDLRGGFHSYCVTLVLTLRQEYCRYWKRRRREEEREREEQAPRQIA